MGARRVQPLLSWLDRMPVTAVCGEAVHAWVRLGRASGPKTGLKFNSRADRKGACTLPWERWPEDRNV